MITKIYTIIFSFILFVFVGALVLTPATDKFGNATQPVKYWVDDNYFNNNF
jgi:hypothetical protein